MSSTMSTAIIANPEGARADALRQWAARNKDTLIDHRSKFVELYSPTKKKTITKIEAIQQKKAHNTWQEETFVIKLTLPRASVEHLHLYLGCSKCNRNCEGEVNQKFTCQYCVATDVVADPRVVLKLDAVDDTGSMQLCAFAKDIQQLLGLSAFELWTFTQNNDMDPIAEKMHALREATLLITIGPTLALTTSKVLSWAIRATEYEAEGNDKDVAAVSASPSTGIEPSADADADSDPGVSPSQLSGVPFSQE